MVEKFRCELCGAEAKHPVTKEIDGRALNFCCKGCLQVYELQREEGLLPDQNGHDLPAQFQKEQASAVDGKFGGTVSSITLPIVGMTCANCVAHVERSLHSVPGVLNVMVNLAAERATVEIISGALTMSDLKQAVEDAGYQVLEARDSI